MNKERVMRGRGSLAKRSPSRVWDDGLHFIRPASDDDDHPLRFIVTSRRGLPVTAMRRFATLDEAIMFAVRSSKAVMKQHPVTARHFKVPTLPPAATDLDSKLPVAYRQKPKAKPIDLPKFAVTHFDCVRANPIAQVWQCVALPGEIGGSGRRKKGGGAPTQAPFNHRKGECAVLLWKEPVREEDGSVRVFPSWQAAEEYALNLYYGADEEERIYWTEDDPCVWRTPNVNIMFDPNNPDTSVRRPFYLYVPKFNKAVPAGFRKKTYAKTGKKQTGGEFIPGTADEKAALAFNQKLAAMAAEEEANKQLSLGIATFKSIWGAEDHATNITERVLRGERVDV